MAFISGEYRIKGDWQSLVGQQIVAVVNSAPDARRAFAQVHLVFSDGCSFEIFSTTGDLGGSSRLYRGDLEEVLSHMTDHRHVEAFEAERKETRLNSPGPVVRRRE